MLYICSEYKDVEVIVRPRCTVECTSVASVSTVDSGLTNLIHDRCSSVVEWLCLTGLQRHPYVVCSHSLLFTLGKICSLKRKQAIRRERESGLQVINSLEIIVEIGRKVGHELRVPKIMEISSGVLKV